MQALDWYYRRLRVMSPGEVAWRARSSVRDRTDRFLVGRRQRLRMPAAFLNGAGRSEGRGFRVSDMAVGDRTWLKPDGENETLWSDSLMVRAEQIAAHRLDLFDLRDTHLGDPIVWTRDYKRGQDTPMIFSPSIDYRDVHQAGDCKFVWEPNRHHQLVVLGRAYRLSGDVRFANAVAEQLGSWLAQNPYGLGMNWRSGLELGTRLINWVWALDLIEESSVIDDQLRHRLLDAVSRHVWEIDRKYSRGSSVNNHLIGEAAGVFVATSYFTNLKDASRWQARSREILCREILSQTFPDGGSVEQSVGYHSFVLQFFVIVGITARITGQDMPESYWSRLERMFEFLGTLSEGGDKLPMFGDCDDGYVLDLAHDPRDVRQWLSVGASLYTRPDFKGWAGAYAEPGAWLPGQPGHQRFKAISEPHTGTITSTAFEDTGCYLLQYGECASPDRISVVFDCGPLGMGALAAHGHADALSFTLRAFGKDVFVDPGTYDYFSYPKWRDYFRSTRAHNTVVVDGREQSEMLGLFLWGRRANACCLNWEPTDIGGTVIGEHDGYTHLTDPVTHRRSLELDGPNRRFLVCDNIMASAQHTIEIYFHLAEHCGVQPTAGNGYLVDAGQGTITIEFDSRLKVRQVKGSEDPICGWVSRGYHRKQATTTLVGCCTCQGETSLVCMINVGNAARVSTPEERTHMR